MRTSLLYLYEADRQDFWRSLPMQALFSLRIPENQVSENRYC
jgi:hypothetical protein